MNSAQCDLPMLLRAGVKMYDATIFRGFDERPDMNAALFNNVSTLQVVNTHRD